MSAGGWIKTSAVGQLVQEVLARREQDERVVKGWAQSGRLGRALAAAIADEMDDHGSWDPEADQRVRWCRQVIAAGRMGHRPVADAGDEELVKFLMKGDDDEG